jgi:hypothetical protein
MNSHASTPLPEAWLRGPLPGIAPELQPAAHALVQSAEDLARAATGLRPDELWTRPGGAASAGFHLRHIAGSIDRLLSYARGDTLDAHQRQALAAEGSPGDPPVDAQALILEATAAIEAALDEIRRTPRGALLDPRSVGRANLPTSLGGILFHIAEHTQRHTGQLITTAKIVHGLGELRGSESRM